jgi:hypothetical protein
MTRALDGYRTFLLRRDGAAHLAARRLDERERFFQSLAAEPLRGAAPIEAAAFVRNLARGRPERHLDARTLWLLATAQANRAERYAVSLEQRRQRIAPDDVIRVHVALQEHYHTRLLAEVVAMFGLPLGDDDPPRFVRAIVHAVVSTPERLALPLVGASELAGCAVFKMLRDRGVELFADQPAVAGRIRRLYDEILADEIGHVGYVAARLGRGGRRVMRTLFGALGPQMVRGLPEMRLLFDAAVMKTACRDALNLHGLAATVPDLAYVAAVP